MMNEIRQAEAEAVAAQEELAATLAELQDRLNVPKQAQRLGRTLKQNYQENTTTWVAAAAGVAATVAGILIWRARR